LDIKITFSRYCTYSVFIIPKLRIDNKEESMYETIKTLIIKQMEVNKQYEETEQKITKGLIGGDRNKLLVVLFR